MKNIKETQYKKIDWLTSHKDSDKNIKEFFKNLS